MNKLFLATVLVAAPFFARAQSAGEPIFYVQPSVVGAALGSDFKQGTGESLALGLVVKGPHAVAADFTYFTADNKVDSYLSFKVKFTQYLVTYRFEAPLSSGWFVHAGAVFGVTRERVDGVTYGGVYFDSFGGTDDALTYGVQADVTYRFSHSIGVVLGARPLRVDKTYLVTAGWMTLASVGLNFRF